MWTDHVPLPWSPREVVDAIKGRIVRVVIPAHMRDVESGVRNVLEEIAAREAEMK